MIHNNTVYLELLFVPNSLGGEHIIRHLEENNFEENGLFNCILNRRVENDIVNTDMKVSGNVIKIYGNLIINGEENNDIPYEILNKFNYDQINYEYYTFNENKCKVQTRDSIDGEWDFNNIDLNLNLFINNYPFDNPEFFNYDLKEYILKIKLEDYYVMEDGCDDYDNQEEINDFCRQNINLNKWAHEIDEILHNKVVNGDINENTYKILCDGLMGNFHENP